MGNNLSTTEKFADTSGVVFAGHDQFAGILLGLIWAGSAYAIAMIWTTLALIDRWRGPQDKFRTETSSVLTAFLLSTMWPIVMAYMALS